MHPGAAFFRISGSFSFHEAVEDETMDVLLVHPKYNGRSEIPPLGLLSLAASLLLKNIKTVVLDLDILSSDDAEAALEESLKKRRPAVVGVSSMSDSFDAALDVCRQVKCRYADTLTVMGGIHPTVSSDQILKNNEIVDAVVRGEGERTLCELVERALKGLDLSGIDGVSFRAMGEVIHNAERELEKDIDHFSMPAHHLLESSAYRTRNISSSRGCFHHCAFCSIQSVYHHRVRVRREEALIEEIRNLVQLGAKRIMFTDDNFTFSIGRIRKLCKMIKDEGLEERIEFYAEGRMDDICRNPIMAGIMSDSGFRALYVGAESGSPKIQSYYQKGIEPDDILRGVLLCVEQNLTPVVNFILMGPKDTIETIIETIELAKRAFENGAEIAYAETMIPYPGTPIHEALIKDGKYREKGSVFYFESYEGIEMDWFLQRCDIARDITAILHKSKKYYETSKAFHEMSYLEDILKNRVPGDFKDYLSERNDAETMEIERKINVVLSQGK